MSAFKKLKSKLLSIGKESSDDGDKSDFRNQKVKRLNSDPAKSRIKCSPRFRRPPTIEFNLTLDLSLEDQIKPQNSETISLVSETPSSCDSSCNASKEIKSESHSPGETTTEGSVNNSPMKVQNDCSAESDIKSEECDLPQEHTIALKTTEDLTEVEKTTEKLESAESSKENVDCSPKKVDDPIDNNTKKSSSKKASIGKISFGDGSKYQKFNNNDLPSQNKKISDGLSDCKKAEAKTNINSCKDKIDQNSVKSGEEESYEQTIIINKSSLEMAKIQSSLSSTDAEEDQNTSEREKSYSFESSDDLNKNSFSCVHRIDPAKVDSKSVLKHSNSVDDESDQTKIKQSSQENSSTISPAIKVSGKSISMDPDFFDEKEEECTLVRSSSLNVLPDSAGINSLRSLEAIEEIYDLNSIEKPVFNSPADDS